MTVFGRACVAFLVVILLAASPPVAAGPAEAYDATEECVNVAVDRFSDRFDVFVSLFGVIGFGVMTPEPSDGLGFAVYVVPEFCGVTPPMNSPPVPLPLPDDPEAQLYKLLP